MTATSKLGVFVVEDHCDALQYIHKGLKEGLLPFEGLAMMHLDAHPDLMVTSDMDAEVCFKPHDLYEVLASSECGIAEWILPLVYERHLAQLWWIRSPWSDQILDGRHTIPLGRVKCTGLLRTSSELPYFVDDQLYCAREEMDKVAELDLNVSTLAGAAEALPEWAKHKGWVLDICCDYFSTHSPFLEELRGSLGDSGVACIKEVYALPSFRGAATSVPHKQQIAQEAVFSRQMEGLVGGKLDWSQSDSDLAARYPDLLELYPTRGEGLRVVTALVKLLRCVTDKERKAILYMGHCACLPHHPSTKEEVEGMVSGLEQLLRRDGLHRPAIVTIALSAQDGYTPPGVVGHIYSSVIDMLQRLFGALDIKRK
ncbi:unnamed protein product [Chrysoparadoxa australica]